MQLADVPFFAGFLLGWNVAWVPGPINAEILRRGARRGFGAAFVVGLGASCADFCWAAAVSLGAGAIAGAPGLRTGLAWVSTVLLAALAALFLRGAWRSARAAARREPLPDGPAPLETRRGGWLFGFGMALVSPWNLAFWVGAVGQQAVRDAGAGASLLLAGGVVAGALCWCTVLSTASRFGARLPGPAWDAALRTVAAAFLLALGARTAVLLL
ncbi:MAG TPA: LysE family transporter [Planctomycetota bacterium]|nr:LysE family transporter [Planctomycetota bacterium]